jgi:hypothetical protein
MCCSQDPKCRDTSPDKHQSKDKVHMHALKHATFATPDWGLVCVDKKRFAQVNIELDVVSSTASVCLVNRHICVKRDLSSIFKCTLKF